MRPFALLFLLAAAPAAAQRVAWDGESPDGLTPASLLAQARASHYPAPARIHPVPVPEEPQWTLQAAPARERRKVRDITERFLRVFHGKEKPRQPSAGDVTIFLIRGLSFWANGGSDYFPESLQRGLRDAGYGVKVIGSRMHRPPDQKIEDLEQDIRAAPTAHVLLIGHSAGGLDAIEVLEKHPDLAGKVVAIAAIQSPYCGAQQADDILAGNGTAGQKLGLALGVRAAVRALPHLERVSVRKRDGLCKTPPAVPARVKLFSVAGFSDRLEPKEKADGLDDGSVEFERQLIPGAQAVLLQGIMHGDLIRDIGRKVNPNRPRDIPELFIKALAALMLEGRGR